MDEQNYRKILDDGKKQLEHELDAYISDLKERTKDINDFLTISELESKTLNASDHVKQVFTKIASSLLSNINEEVLLESKKENTKQRG